MTSTEKKKVPLTIVQLHCNYHDTIIWLLIGTPPSLYNTLHHPNVHLPAPSPSTTPSTDPCSAPPTSTPPPPPPSCTTSSSSPASSSHSSTSSASAPNSGNSALNHAKSP